MILGNSGICEEDALALHGNLDCQHGNIINKSRIRATNII
jgi:hypothetical protein